MLKMRKGFTLIELIVVISILAILVALGIVAYKGYTKEANLTKHLTYVKELESASERYYMNQGDWPRGSEEPYTSEELANYAERIRDITGKEIELDPEGKYYDIDYAELSKYTKIPKNKANYLLQNPVGQVYYLDGLTHEGQLRGNYGDNPIEEVYKEIVFRGLSPEVFDNNNDTYYSYRGIGRVTWEGDLNNREITILGQAAEDGYFTLNIEFRDSNNNLLTPIGESNPTVVVAGKLLATKKVIVPEGAVYMDLFCRNNFQATVYEISAAENLKVPKEVSNITNDSTESSITLNWEHIEVDYQKVALYRDGTFLKYVNEKTYIDKQLYADSEHTYEIISINIHGNASKKVIYKAKTTKPEIVFRGLSPEVFDNNNDTYYSYRGTGKVTWDGDLTNREITILGKSEGGGYFSLNIEFRDSNNNLLTPIGESNPTVVVAEKILATKKVIVPEGAVYMDLFCRNNFQATVYEITVDEKLQ